MSRKLFWTISSIFAIVGSFLILLPKPKSPKEPPIQLSSLKPNLAQIDTSSMTVSGISSGAIMAVTFHYMFSAKFKGCGSFGGGPFGLLHNVSHRDFLPAYFVHMLGDMLPVFGRSTKFLEQQAIELSNQGLIDHVSNLNGSKTFVYQGGLDTVNPPIFQMGQKTIDMNTYFGSDVNSFYIWDATHCIPTDNYGGPCAIFDVFHNGVNNCHNQSIFYMFSHFFGPDYIEPESSTTPPTGQFYQFDQNPFAISGNAISEFMNNVGGIYVPKACEVATATCKLHMAVHGCYQSWYSNVFSDVFAIKTGYFQVGDANNMIVLFPRAVPIYDSFQLPEKSSLGCWDYFGGTTLTPELKELPQVKVVTNILNFIIGFSLF